MVLLSPSSRRGTNLICPWRTCGIEFLICSYSCYHSVWYLYPLHGCEEKNTDTHVYTCTCMHMYTHIHTWHTHYWVHPANQVSEGYLLRACQQHHLLFSCLNSSRIAPGLSHQDWWAKWRPFQGGQHLKRLQMWVPFGPSHPFSRSQDMWRYGEQQTWQ